MYVKAATIPYTTSICADSRAILQGMKYSINNNLLLVVIKIECLQIKRVLDRECKVPWGLVMDVEKIK